MIKEKLLKIKEKLVNKHMYSATVVVLICVVIGVGASSYKKQKEYRQTMENQYNMAFYELVDYVQNVETYLAKSLISKTPEHGAETLTHVWREANLALSYLGLIPVSSNELSSAAKFLNQTSDYAYTLSRKNIYNEPLTDEDLSNLEMLYNNAIALENTLNQLSAEINEGKIQWGELNKKGNLAFAQQVSNMSVDGLKNIDQNLQEYAGLIYDGAFSEHMTSAEKMGLTGEEIDENKAKEVVINFIGKDRIEDVNYDGTSYGDIEAFTFYVKIKGSNKENICVAQVSKKGGHIVYMSYNRNVDAEIIDFNEASKIGRNYLSLHEFTNMKETYYIKQAGVMTINYAYTQNNITIYPDLVKLKIALDDGEILGIETTGYLNCHYVRNIEQPQITMIDAKKTINENVEILSEGLAIIPTKFRTEILCYEFKGKIDGRDFIVYINAKNGREEDILVIVNTPNGVLTM